MTASSQLLGAAETIAAVFPGEKSRPALRTFREWQARGFIPVHRIGKRTFFDPEQVRLALDRRFRIDAKPADPVSPSRPVVTVRKHAPLAL